MKFLVTGILTLIACQGFSQRKVVSASQAVEQALKNNESIKAASFQLESEKQLRKASFDLPKTEVSLLYGQYNSYSRNDNNITVSQAIPFSVFGTQRSLNTALVTSGEMRKSVTENDIIYQVKQVYHQLVFTCARHRLLQRQDSIYEGFFKSASLRYKTGETKLLEQTTAEMQWNESKNQLRQNEAEMARLRTQLQILIGSPFPADMATDELTTLTLENMPDTLGYKENPSLAYMHQQIDVAQSEKKLQTSKLAPDLLIGFFSQTLIGTPDNESGNLATASERFTGFQIGISLPLWFAPHQARIRSAEFKRKAAESNFAYFETSLQGQLLQAIQQLSANKNSLDYYTASGLPNSDRILKQSQVAFKEGEIDYAEYLLGIRNAISIQEGYLKTINDYNQHVIHIEYLTGNK
jgi:cobalt-zinc-cadmium resistance protein CzcA